MHNAKSNTLPSSPPPSSFGLVIKSGKRSVTDCRLRFCGVILRTPLLGDRVSVLLESLAPPKSGNRSGLGMISLRSRHSRTRSKLTFDNTALNSDSHGGVLKKPLKR